MRIIKEGKDTDGLVRFECKNCGCEFECEQSEYWVDTSVCLTSFPCKHTVYTSCPNCHRICTSYTRASTETSYPYVTATNPKTVLDEKTIVFGMQGAKNDA